MTATVAARVLEWRRHLHRHPECAFAEHETARFVAGVLGELAGVDVSHPTPTSVLGRLRGSAVGPTLALRADIDALPVHEQTGAPYASVREGAMHACGHDGHTAMLLGAATVLADQPTQLRGEVRFVFQHAEELPPGGARDLVAAGVVDGVDAVLGLHLWAPLAYGTVAVSAGRVMAAVDTFEIEVIGRGGHAGLPHTAVDAIAVAAQVVGGLQHVVARQVDPLQSAVVSVTLVQGGSTFNVLPDTVRIAGTVRTFDDALRSSIPDSIERIVAGICGAHGARHAFVFHHGYAPVVNDAQVSATIAGVVRDRMPDVELVPMTPIMGGDDVSAYLQRVPGCYVFVGAGGRDAYPHHHPRFDIDERALDVGLRVLVESVRAFWS